MDSFPRGTPATPTCGQSADLLWLVDGGPAGRHAGTIDGSTRTVLLRRGWATNTTREGEPAGAREWAGTLHATTDGATAAAAVAGRPVELVTAAAARPLLAVERGTPLDGWWPGSAQAWRVAQRWGLVDFTPRGTGTGALGKYQLTPAGVDALARWRAGYTPPRRASRQQAAALAVLDAGSRVYVAPGAIDECLAYGWLTVAPPAGYTGDNPLCAAGFDWINVGDGYRDWFTVTAAGRAAAAAYREHPFRAAAVTRVAVGELEAGQRCRLSHRGGWRNLGPQWEVFVRAVRHGRPGGWEVWVEDGQGGERRYVDGMVGYGARFDVQR